MTIAAIIILVAYLAYAIHKTRSIPNCLSDTAYTVGKNIFAVTMMAICALMWCPLLNALQEDWQWLVFLSVVGIAAMAVSPYREDKITHNIHYAGTLLSMLCVLGMWLTKGIWQIPFVVVATSMLLPCITRKWLLIVELLMFSLAFGIAIIYNS